VPPQVLCLVAMVQCRRLTVATSCSEPQRELSCQDSMHSTAASGHNNLCGVGPARSYTDVVSAQHCSEHGTTMLALLVGEECHLNMLTSDTTNFTDDSI
jgi:hypothetical protein